MTEAYRELVWDIRSGFIIDASTGEVIGEVYADNDDLAAVRSKKHDGPAFIRDHKAMTPILPEDDPKRLMIYYKAVGAAAKLGMDSGALRTQLKRTLMKIDVRYVRDKEAFTAALLYYAAKRVGLKVWSPRRIIIAVGADPWRTWEYYGRYFGKTSRMLEDVLVAAGAIVSMLRYPRGLFHACRVLARRLDEVFVSGRTTRVIAAGLVDAAKWLCPYARELIAKNELTQSMIAEAAGVSEVALRYTAHKIMKRLGIEFKPKNKYMPTFDDIIIVPRGIYEELRPILDHPYSKYIIPKEVDSHG